MIILPVATGHVNADIPPGMPPANAKARRREDAEAPGAGEKKRRFARVDMLRTDGFGAQTELSLRGLRVNSASSRSPKA